MGPGHFGVGLALKPAAPKVPLVILLIATVLLDLLSFGFLASGLEETNQTHFDLTSGITLLKPGSLGWSHGLFMSLVWSTMAAVITFLIFKQKRGALIVSGLVFSYWVLDFIVHLSDLPLFFDGSPLLGLGLWGTGPGFIISIFLEVFLLLVGFIIFYEARKQASLQSKV